MPALTTPDAPAMVRHLLEFWHRGECAIAVAAVGLVAVLLIIDMVGREFAYPLLGWLGVNLGPMGIHGAQRMAVYALVLATYVGVGVATATAAHLVPEVAFRVVPARFDSRMDRLADAVSALLLLVAAWFGAQFVWGTFTTQVRAPMLQWVVWPFQLAIPFGFASAALRYACYAVWPSLRPRRTPAGT